VQVLLDFSASSEVYGGWWYGCAEFEVFLECGASVKFPDAGSQSICDHCGANIYANDVFKKIKDLIG